MSQTIAELTAEHQSDVDSWIELGMKIMEHYGVDPNLSVYKNLDLTYESWADDEGSKPAESEIMLGLGAVLGNRLGHKHDTKWQLVSDEHGTDFMILIKGYQIYPIDFVAKRIATLSSDEPEFGFFAGIDSVIDSWP